VHVQEIVNSIVAFNSCAASNLGCGIYATAAATISYTDVAENENSDVSGDVVFVEGSDGNFSEDPYFVSWAKAAGWESQDLHLWTVADGYLFDSPGVDAGDPDVADWDFSMADLGYYGGPEAP
jgi:hypothetical protein